MSRGGNFLLNIGPDPDGIWGAEAYQRLEGIGAWMKVNGEAIYGPQPIAPYEEDGFVYTQTSDSCYAIYLNKEAYPVPTELMVTLPAGFSAKAELLGFKASVKTSHKKGDDYTHIYISPEMKKKMAASPAWVFKFEKRGK